MNKFKNKKRKGFIDPILFPLSLLIGLLIGVAIPKKTKPQVYQVEKNITRVA